MARNKLVFPELFCPMAKVILLESGIRTPPVIDLNLFILMLNGYDIELPHKIKPRPEINRNGVHFTQNLISKNRNFYLSMH
ncbi:hypothetical protein BJF95_22095 [Rhizobium oryziradicis]|uniref:Uncharacterized protein n=1 Tax=Rhizobium oryziradicis TaxID=1867956 RepID=A0A1Q8ZNU5_9HYPH|nr:hypothetical protein BJF95_22095 [Rhizobium oryziradicis]